MSYDPITQNFTLSIRELFLLVAHGTMWMDREEDRNRVCEWMAWDMLERWVGDGDREALREELRRVFREFDIPTEGLDPVED